MTLKSELEITHPTKLFREWWCITVVQGHLRSSYQSKPVCDFLSDVLIFYRDFLVENRRSFAKYYPPHHLKPSFGCSYGT